MNAFVKAIGNQEARTQNGMKARASSSSANVDFFFKAGAMRNQDIVPVFAKAFGEDSELALRNAQWLRDVRGGAGERQLFRDIMGYLEKTHPAEASKLVKKIPEVGRWDDLFVLTNPDLKKQAFDLLGDALREKNGLAAKWTPRKGPLAAEIRAHFGMSPKFYRKSLVELTNVVESAMCAKDWDNINFSHVPSVAAARYKKAFFRNSPEVYKAYVEALKTGVDKDGKVVKINASAIFPYDVLRDILSTSTSYASTTNLSAVELGALVAQWEALPNYVGDASVLPIVDTSASMTWVEVAPGLQPMHIARGLALYLADKNRGPFKDAIMDFNDRPTLTYLRGNIVDKVAQFNEVPVGGSTNLHAAIQKILDVGVMANVPAEDMPKMLLIMSDMQFNGCTRYDDSAMQMIERKYKEAGYAVPQIVFWNLHDKGTVPVASDKSGAALVSGYSPSIVKSVLAADMDEFTPEGIMLKTLMAERYDLPV